MDEDLKKKQNEENLLFVEAIKKRVEALDAPVKELMFSNDYQIKLKEISNSHSLEKADLEKLEELTTNFLLGTIRPKELEQTFIEQLKHLNKEKIRNLYNDIKTKILNSVWNIVDRAWEEDDQEEKEWEEFLDMADVPPPPNLQKSEAIADVTKKVDRTNITQVHSREQIDRTIPEFEKFEKDRYREIPE